MMYPTRVQVDEGDVDAHHTPLYVRPGRIPRIYTHYIHIAMSPNSKDKITTFCSVFILRSLLVPFVICTYYINGLNSSI